MVQVLESLPNKHEALSWNSSTPKKKKRKRTKEKEKRQRFSTDKIFRELVPDTSTHYPDFWASLSSSPSFYLFVLLLKLREA
jgi:hypothetical protein